MRETRAAELASCVSPAEVEALVAEAERGYEDMRAQFVGRPEDPEVKALRRIAFRVPTKLRDAAQRRADKEEMSLADFAAEALRQHLGRSGRRA